MGDPNKKYNTNIEIVCLEDIQLRHNAIESARQVINRRLNKHIGATNYLYEIRMYPHHILRENKMLTGAGSDRMQTGMQRAFGRTVGSAAQVKRNKTMMKISFDKKGRTFVIDAIKVGFSKLPCRNLMTTPKPNTSANNQKNDNRYE